MRGLNTGVGGIGGGEYNTTSLEVRTQTTFEGRLREEKEQLECRLKDVNSVLDALKNAPEVTKVVEALHKLGY